jgi:uncharacterized protein (DUF1800 family)
LRTSGWDEVNRWDPTIKTVFGQSGRFTWEDACRLVVTHPLHPSFFVAKLWSYFIPEPPSPDVAAKLEAAYRDSGLQIRPIVEAILCSPEFYEGPRMIKPPAVFTAGMLRARELPIDDERWVWLADGAGQRLYHPPDVSGWDDKRWLDSNTIRARWELVNYAVAGLSINPGSTAGRTYPAETPEQATAAARAFWGGPRLEPDTVDWLLAFAREYDPPADTASTPQYLRTQRAQVRAQRQNLLRHLIAASADYQTS